MQFLMYATVNIDLSINKMFSVPSKWKYPFSCHL